MNAIPHLLTNEESSQNILLITTDKLRTYISDLTTTFKGDFKFSEIKLRKTEIYNFKLIKM